MTPYCGLKHSTRCLAASPDLSDKPLYQRVAIQANEKFIAFLGTISPKAQKQYVQLLDGKMIWIIIFIIIENLKGELSLETEGKI